MSGAALSPNQISEERDNTWLEEKMYYLWENFFCDVPRKNDVVIRFGRRAKRQLGSIRMIKKGNLLERLISQGDDPSVTEIRISGYMKDPHVPEFVVTATIAHEMIHYAHGFQSPLGRQFKHPHRGSLVKKEMISRGMGDIWAESEEWIRKHWSRFVRLLR